MLRGRILLSPSFTSLSACALKRDLSISFHNSSLPQKMFPVTGNPVPCPSALNLPSNTGVFLKEQGARAQELLYQAQSNPGALRALGHDSDPTQLMVGVQRTCPYEPCWGKTSSAHRADAGENLSKHLPLLHLAPPELLAEALLSFSLN